MKQINKSTNIGKGEKEKLELLTIQWEYGVGLTDTAAAVQYAYFLDEKGEVIKKLVKQR